MVSAGAANKKTFGIDRAAQPMVRYPHRRSHSHRGFECCRVFADYDELRVASARKRGEGHRRRPTNHADLADLRSVSAGETGDSLFNGILHLMIEHDWVDHEFINEFTNGVDAVAEHVREWTPQRTAEVTGITEKAIRQAAELWGRAQTSFLLHARGIEHHSHGVITCSAR